MRIFGKQDGCPNCTSSRRRFLRAGAGLAVGAAATLLLPGSVTATTDAPQSTLPAMNGSRDPSPIPWPDKNGSHNQSPGPNQEPSSIYHFKGRVGRANDFTGMGTDNKGNRLAFGSPSTDFSFMQGEYFAARAPQRGAFSHI